MPGDDSIGIAKILPTQLLILLSSKYSLEDKQQTRERDSCGYYGRVKNLRASSNVRSYSPLHRHRHRSAMTMTVSISTLHFCHIVAREDSGRQLCLS